MPIHDLSYREWNGARTPASLRFWVIAQTGIRLAWRSHWLRRLVFFAWLPAAYFGIAFLVLEQSFAHQTELDMASGFLGQFPQAQYVVEEIASGDPVSARRHAWAWLLLTFFRYPQGFVLVLVVGLIAPPLIARDVHTRAFLLYFSRPLSRVEYVLGKLSVVAAYVFLISAAPALVLYVLAVLLSPPELAIVSSTWDLPLRILLASLVLVLPTATLTLAFSSLTSRAMYAGFAWFAVWFLGIIAYGVLSAGVSGLSADWSLLSLYHTLGKVQTAVFGLPVALDQEFRYADAFWSIVVLLGLTVASTTVVLRRVSSPMRI